MIMGLTGAHASLSLVLTVLFQTSFYHSVSRLYVLWPDMLFKMFSHALAGVCGLQCVQTVPKDHSENFITKWSEMSLHGRCWWEALRSKKMCCRSKLWPQVCRHLIIAPVWAPGTYCCRHHIGISMEPPPFWEGLGDFCVRLWECVPGQLKEHMQRQAQVLDEKTYNRGSASYQRCP